MVHVRLIEDCEREGDRNWISQKRATNMRALPSTRRIVLAEVESMHMPVKLWCIFFLASAPRASVHLSARWEQKRNLAWFRVWFRHLPNKGLKLRSK